MLRHFRSVRRIHVGTLSRGGGCRTPLRSYPRVCQLLRSEQQLSAQTFCPRAEYTLLWRPEHVYR